MIDQLKSNLLIKMKKSIEHLRNEFSGLRTGRASINLLDSVKVSIYGSEMPLNQCATLSVPDSQTISVSVWDRSNISAVEKAIIESELGLNPASDGTLIRIPIPPLNEERRKELVKVANNYAEQGRIAIRNIRREGIDEIKKAEKAKEISEDMLKDYEKQIQDLTDTNIKEVDTMLKTKEADIMTV
ncbi:MAG: ribosome recycling factor [Alphaproteobacteria bacterium]|jgi:ribosome recycling factor|nr:ribosome recycling factor [Alphaproteobacteria bacterium]